MADRAFGAAAADIRLPMPSRLAPMVAIYWLVTAVALLAFTLPGALPSPIRENDDIMRLVEVRDLLAGQSWFDMTQYRLGLAEGTLMHWSRFIDLPIALLIRLFSLFLSQAGAEAAAATVWPVLLMPLLLLPLGLAARRIGGVLTMHIALAFGALFIFTCDHFSPGSLDHHNAQLTLAMWIAAMLTDPLKRAGSYVVAGIACALAIAIGAETLPLVAVACLCVAALWLWHGEPFAPAARAFGLSLTLSISAAFFLTVPACSYAVVTCDNLSLGFYALSALGGAALFLLASLPGGPSRPVRLVLTGVTGATLLLAARIIAPQCLGDPLGSLDPMLVDLWLNGVTEARSFAAEAAAEPEMVGGFYAVGFFALIICLFRSLGRKEVEFHLVLLALIGVSWGVSLLQVRGVFFANMLAILPLSLLITDLRRVSAADPENANAALGYISAVLASVPIVWAVGGIVTVNGWSAADVGALAKVGTPGLEAGECGGPADMAALNALPLGVVAAPSNSGPEILAATRQRVLTGPYHRDQKGMLTELHIGLATPAEAEAFLKGAGVTLLAFCGSDPQTRSLIRLKSDGLYASLARGVVPAYLAPIGRDNAGGFRLYRVRFDAD